ncbi:DUF3014 domain-containing protein [Allofranklinella schreckenbergeri]|uniref:DUF3014 domain-containing protein n=1 Tax=Allofranklinella schreckenbergeri TaxID=1076744 RepID=A0A3M6Q905_9BURK|nr:DUF3014 domain-containing protein [Allofranklinella schreckenbergeri]RMW99592.1 DUF3014 domain-containing protein [Allofranklinella schreckenbergeri]
MTQRIRAHAHGLAPRPRRRPWKTLTALALAAAVAVWLWQAPQERQRLLHAGQSLSARWSGWLDGLSGERPGAKDQPAAVRPDASPAPTPDAMTALDNPIPLPPPPPEDAAALAPPSVPVAETAAETAATAEAAPASPASPSHPLHALEPLEPAAAALPALDASDAHLRETLAALAPAVSGPAAAWVRPERLVRRFVATVDNLTAERAPTAQWPVHPTPPRFLVDGGEADAHIAPANHARYAAAMQFVRQLDVPQAARQYRQHYALFQQAYEELGYPGRYFNDRLVAVIDHLLQTPEPATPPRVQLMPVRSTVASQQPWVRYQFVDPQLEALSAGQKMLLRMGADNTRAIKAQLRAFRAAITAQPVQ